MCVPQTKRMHRCRLLALEGALAAVAEAGEQLHPARSLALGLDHAAQRRQLGLDAQGRGDRVAVVHAVGGVEEDGDAEGLGLDRHPLGDARRLGGKGEVVAAAGARGVAGAQVDGASAGDGLAG